MMLWLLNTIGAGKNCNHSTDGTAFKMWYGFFTRVYYHGKRDNPYPKVYLGIKSAREP